MIEMTQKIISKNGTEITLAISRTQEAPKIVAEKFEIGGKKVYGAATVQPRMAGTKQKTEAGLFFWTPQRTYVQCAAAMPMIWAAIAELPHKEYWARKVDDTTDADGDIIAIQRWEFDKLLETEAGTTIGEERMGDFLDSKGITEIKIVDAVKMWAEEKEEAHIKANEAGNARAKAIFEADEAEEGYNQACENAGIPRWMR